MITSRLNSSTCRCTLRLPSCRTVKESLTVASRRNSPSSNRLRICRLTFCVVVWNNSAICACESQTLSSTKRTSSRVAPSSVWYKRISPSFPLKEAGGFRFPVPAMGGLLQRLEVAAVEHQPLEGLFDEVDLVVRIGEGVRAVHVDVLELGVRRLDGDLAEEFFQRRVIRHREEFLGEIAVKPADTEFEYIY